MCVLSLCGALSHTLCGALAVCALYTPSLSCGALAVPLAVCACASTHGALVVSLFDALALSPSLSPFVVPRYLSVVPSLCVVALSLSLKLALHAYT